MFLPVSQYLRYSEDSTRVCRLASGRRQWEARGLASGRRQWEACGCQHGNGRGQHETCGCQHGDGRGQREGGRRTSTPRWAWPASNMRTSSRQHGDRRGQREACGRQHGDGRGQHEACGHQHGRAWSSLPGRRYKRRAHATAPVVCGRVVPSRTESCRVAPSAVEWCRVVPSGAESCSPCFPAPTTAPLASGCSWRGATESMTSPTSRRSIPEARRWSKWMPGRTWAPPCMTDARTRTHVQPTTRSTSIWSATRVRESHQRSTELDR